MRTEFRLPGYGGAAMFLRSHVVAPRTLGTAGQSLAFDIGFLSPDRFTWYLALPAGDGFAERLATFLFRAAADFHPEDSLQTFSDPVMGLTISVRTSTDSRVELEVTLVEEADAAVDDSDGLSFETSRVVLASSAQAASVLVGGSVAAFDMEF